MQQWWTISTTLMQQMQSLWHIYVLREPTKINTYRIVNNWLKREYRKTSDSSRVPYTSRAPDTGRWFKWIVPIEAGSRLHAGSRVQAGSGCKPGESWYLLTYRSQLALTSANMANWRRLTCTDRSRVPVISQVPDTGRGLKWIVPIEAGGFYPRFYGTHFLMKPVTISS